MTKAFAENTDNTILHRLFRKGEISYTISDFSKAIGPMIDLMFIGKFIGTDGVTVMGYVAPLIMLSWVSKIANMLILSLIAVVYISLQKGQKFTDKMLLLPEDFGIPRENEIAVIAGTTKDIEDLSRIAVAFALEHGAERKRALTYGLITEELSVLLQEHGFSDGRPHNINARLVAKGGDLIIRIRDDCKPFNITEYYELIKDDQDKEKEISLAIIMKMAKDVKYTAAFGANNLIVRI